MLVVIIIVVCPILVVLLHHLIIFFFFEMFRQIVDCIWFVIKHKGMAAMRQSTGFLNQESTVSWLDDFYQLDHFLFSRLWLIQTITMESISVRVRYVWNSSLRKRVFILGKKHKIGHLRIDEQGKATFKRLPTNHLIEAMQLGIRHTVGGLESHPPIDVLYQDFGTIETISFPK